MKNKFPTASSCVSARSIFTMTVVLLAVVTFSFPTFRRFAATPKASAAVMATVATISGRVVDVRGRGIGRAMMSISDMTGHSMGAVTNPFGYYRLANITVGSAYVIRVSGKHFIYSQGTRAIEVMDDVSDIDFVSDN
ncbi:MAG: carboxypeptidase-like regulatory domain-containing protein [Acidobacteriota bacterium]